MRYHVLPEHMGVGMAQRCDNPSCPLPEHFYREEIVPGPSCAPECSHEKFVRICFSCGGHLGVGRKP